MFETRLNRVLVKCKYFRILTSVGAVMENHLVATAAANSEGQARSITILCDEVLRLWSERVCRENTSVTMSGRPVLADYMPVLYDNIAQVVILGMSRPFSTNSRWSLSDYIMAAERAAFACADDVVKELQIFRNVIFATAKRRTLGMSDEQCERIGYIIDGVIREAIIVCSAVERDIRESFIAELSHDLRNPLNIASALAQLIQRRPDNEKVAMMATRIYEKIAETDAMLQSTVATMSKK
jgi:signal transduction histidine kinase